MLALKETINYIMGMEQSKINIELSRWADNNEITGAWARALAERGDLRGAHIYAGKWYLPYDTKKPKLKIGRPVKKRTRQTA